MATMISGEHDDVGPARCVECGQYAPHVVIDAQQLRTHFGSFRAEHMTHVVRGG